jgi:Calcineurin-like phosphoesterase
VDPLLTKSRNDSRIRVLHISDLHLVEDLIHPDRGGSPTVGQLGHSIATAKLLGMTVDSLQPPFDMLLATGDLTTDGSQGAFETVLQYIQSGPISGENKMRIATFGLSAGPRRRLLLPGNHDRFNGKTFPGERLSYSFEEILGTEKSYPYVRGFRPPGQTSEDLTLLFFVFDSTLPSQHEPGVNRLEVIAQGIIGVEEINRLKAYSCKAEKDCEVTDLKGEAIKFDRKNTIRIALLHHHPVATREDEEQGSPHGNPITNPVGHVRAWMKSATKLINAEHFLEGCFEAGIQLILFGHDHRPYRRAIVSMHEVCGAFGPTTSLRAFCCPTTLEVSKDGNGFYVFDFMNKDDVSLDLYVSTPNKKKIQGPFIRNASQSGTFKLSELSDEEKSSAHFLGSYSRPSVWQRPAIMSRFKR